jgi:hypothetical protein
MKMVEVHHMIVDVLRTYHQIADEFGVLWNVDTQGVLHGSDRGKSVNHRTNSTDTLRDVRSIAWITTLHDNFNAPSHCTGAVCLGNGFSISAEFSFNAQVSLNPCDRIYYNICSHINSPKLRATKTRLIKQLNN